MADPFADEPRRRSAHEIGQDLSLLSVDELDERIELLSARSPVSRPTRSAKHHRASWRDSFFKRWRLSGLREPDGRLYLAFRIRTVVEILTDR